MDDESLFMLCDPKKCKKTQPKMDVFINNYKSHKNELNTLNNLDNNDINIKKNEVIPEVIPEVNTDVIPEVIPEVTIDVPEVMIDVLEHINYIDNFILNNNYDTNMEKINDYLIDLLFLIKSKKNN